MSAWLVSKEHIDVLVTAAISLDVVQEEGASIVGNTLWQENATSLRYRYEDADEYWDLPAPDAYKFEPRPVESLYYVNHQVHCFNYQACEHPEYEDSPAYLFVLAITHAMEEKLGLEDAAIFAHPEGAKATWGVQVRPDGQLWLDQDEYWAWYREEQRKEQEASDGI